MSAPAPQRARQALSRCAARNLSSFPERTLSHTTRAIKYVFLDGCQNVTASRTTVSAGTHEVYKESVTCHPKAKRIPRVPADCWLPLPEYLPIFHTLPTHPEKQAKGLGHSLVSKKRLPVFRQLCGEAVPAMALGDMCLETSSQELKELSDAKAPREGEERLEVEAGSGVLPLRHGMN